MKKTYPVILDSHSVGTVQVEKQGLYYQFDCRCSIPAKGVHTLSVQSGKHSESLGTCIPVGTAFGLTTKVPVKHFPQEELSFTVVKKDTHAKEIFIPLNSDRPFSYLMDIERARFCNSDGKPVVAIGPNCHCPAKEDSEHP